MLKFALFTWHWAAKFETFVHPDIKILCNKFRHWLQIGQAMILYTLEMLFMSKELCVVLQSEKIFDVKLAEAYMSNSLHT